MAMSRTNYLCSVILPNVHVSMTEGNDNEIPAGDAVSRFDVALKWLLRPFSHWDAVYFLSVAENGDYPFEQIAAFFPGLPLMMRGLASICTWIEACRV